MKLTTFVLLLALPSAAFAQQAPQVSPMAYVNALTTQRNAAQDAAALAQAQLTDLQAKFDALQKEDDALKAKTSPPDMKDQVK